MATKFRGVRDGTVFGTPLCRTCRKAQIVTGSSLSQKEIWCHAGGMEPHVLKFEAYECSEYDDKRLPSKWDMEQIAWVFVTNVAGRAIGFVSAKEYKEKYKREDE